MYAALICDLIAIVLAVVAIYSRLRQRDWWASVLCLTSMLSTALAHVAKRRSHAYAEDSRD